MLRNKDYYDEFFTKYPADVHNDFNRFTFVSNLIKGKVLDIGCGTGTLSEYYFNDYVGVDFCDVAISKAKELRRKDAVFYVSDITEKLFFEKESFDSVYLGEVLEHIEDDSKLFEEVLKVLKPSGKIFISVPNGNRIPDESHCRIFTVPQIRKDYSKYGKLKFYNWSGANGRIIFSIDPSRQNENKLALVMIVKNEEKGLEKSILSALPIVDKVVISVDSASEDKTFDIAKLYADDLKSHYWQDDFSKARNEAQKNVKTDYILFLDGHEYIESYGDFREKIEKNLDGVFVTIRMESGLIFVYPRIFKSHLKFKNAVHNLVECKTKTLSPKFVIVHDRDNLQDKKSAEIRNAQREKMMPKELMIQIEKEPKNARAYFHLANFYMMREKIDEAMFNYKKAIKFGKSKDEKYLCLLHLGALHLTKGHTFRALSLFLKADKLEPNRWESMRVIGVFYLQQGKFETALKYLVNALKPNPRLYSYQPMKFDLVATWDLIGHCFAKLDKNEKAVSAWKRALKLTKNEKQKKLFNQKIKLVSSLIPCDVSTSY